jgi:hypothetical protein
MKVCAARFDSRATYMYLPTLQLQLASAGYCRFQVIKDTFLLGESKLLCRFASAAGPSYFWPHKIS